MVLLISPILTFLMLRLSPFSPMTFCGPQGGFFCLVANGLPNLLSGSGMSIVTIGLVLEGLFLLVLVIAGVGLLVLYRGGLAAGAILLVVASASCVILSMGFFVSPALMLVGGIVALESGRSESKCKDEPR
jgi:uncharacterized membrane protein